MSRRVHITDVTYRHLTKNYIAEQRNDLKRDTLLRKYNIQTYLLKEDENKPVEDVTTPTPKRQSITVEWIPEIPFRDVGTTIVPLFLQSCYSSYKTLFIVWTPATA